MVPIKIQAQKTTILVTTFWVRDRTVELARLYVFVITVTPSAG